MPLLFLRMLQCDPMFVCSPQAHCLSFVVQFSRFDLPTWIGAGDAILLLFRKPIGRCAGTPNQLWTTKTMTEPRFIPVPDYVIYPPDVMAQRAHDFYQEMRRRRSVRHFSSRPIPPGIIEKCLRTAATAPSGANQQPWHFAVVTDPAIKRQIRVAAEEEEHAFYERRATEEWLDALTPLGTDASKPFLEIAPCLIAVFAQPYSLQPDGESIKHYYVRESVGIAVGMLIAALHHAGLATLTHTPSPMGFLREILGRPSYEHPFLLLVAGYPASDAHVPAITRKSLEEIASFH